MAQWTHLDPQGRARLRLGEFRKIFTDEKANAEFQLYIADVLVVLVRELCIPDTSKCMQLSGCVHLSSRP